MAKNKLWSMTDIAHQVGATRQKIWWRVMHGHIPEPEYMTREGIPYWSEPTAKSIIKDWTDDLRRKEQA